MLSILIDENVDGRIVRGLLRRNPALSLPGVCDFGLTSAADPLVLSVAAKERRVVVTHDVRTMTRFALDRMNAGELMPGLIVVPKWLSLVEAIDDLEIVIECLSQAECESQIIYSRSGLPDSFASLLTRRGACHLAVWLRRPAST